MKNRVLAIGVLLVFVLLAGCALLAACGGGIESPAPAAPALDSGPIVDTPAELDAAPELDAGELDADADAGPSLDASDDGDADAGLACALPEDAGPPCFGHSAYTIECDASPEQGCSLWGTVWCCP